MNSMTFTSTREQLIKRLDKIGKFVGNTPLYPIQSAFSKPGVELYAKLEWQQLGMSVKARAAFQIIKEAILTEELHEGKHLLDATSGNTGIAYASICANIGIPLTICIPENASKERKRLLRAFGTNLIYTSPLEGTDGSQQKAKELYRERPDLYFYADQYNNENNWKAHYLTTAKEIYHETLGGITHFVAGLGTTGTFMGTGRKLKEVNPYITLISYQPETALHGLEGWKDMETAKVPGIYDPSLADASFKISTGEAYDWMKIFAEKEGMLLSPSSAANLAGAVKVAESIDQGIVVTIFPDDASKYGEVINMLFS